MITPPPFVGVEGRNGKTATPLWVSWGFGPELAWSAALVADGLGICLGEPR